MPLKQNKLTDEDLDRIFEVLLEGLEENAELDVKKKIVNSILPVHKYKVLHRFLSEEGLSEEIRLNCLPIFLDENTKYFNFIQRTYNQSTIKNILEIIPRYCPNIETIDFRNFMLESKNYVYFTTFLEQTRSLKSLQVACLGPLIDVHRCDVLRQLLFKDNFDLLHPDVKIGLLKIEFINGFELRSSECTRLLKLLPNLKGLGIYQKITPLLSIINDNDKVLVERLFKITEFGDEDTYLLSLQLLIKFCPNAKRILLAVPHKKVIEHLRNFPLLTELIIEFIDPEFTSEIINLLKEIGKQIKSLVLINPRVELDRDIFHELCPELIELEINPGLEQFLQ